LSWLADWAPESPPEGRVPRNSLLISLLPGNLEVETGSMQAASTTTHSHSNQAFRRLGNWPANRRVSCVHLVSGTRRLALAGLFARVVSGIRKPVPGAGIAIATRRPDQPMRPSIAVWRDHSTGASRRRVTPMPRGSRPSIAAFTRSGARKASDIVMLTWRTPHFSRLAMLSTFAFAFALVKPTASPGDRGD